MSIVIKEDHLADITQLIVEYVNELNRDVNPETELYKYYIRLEVDALDISPEEKQMIFDRCLKLSIEIYQKGGPKERELLRILRNIKVLRALSDPVRVGIIDILSNKSGNICVSEIVKKFDKSQPTISHHLSVLSNANLIGHKKNGLESYYFVNIDTLKEARDFLNDMVLEAEKWTK